MYSTKRRELYYALEFKVWFIKSMLKSRKKLYLAETLMYDVDRFVTRYRNRKSPEHENAEAALDIGTIEILRSSFDGVKKEFISKKISLDN